MKENLAGKITITRTYGGKSPTVLIQLEDALSGTMICDINMSIEEYGNAVTGKGACSCKIDLSDMFN